LYHSFLLVLRTLSCHDGFLVNINPTALVTFSDSLVNFINHKVFNSP
jgi:hypothetical protein